MRTGHPRVLVVGSGWRFTSGISYYTCHLANHLSRRLPTGVVLTRRLIPRFLYPGRTRVGVRVNALEYATDVPVYDGVDWSWGRSLLGAARFVRGQHPDVLVLQWWTGAVLHTYLALVVLARRRGAKVVCEWHELQDTGEARLPLVAGYVRALMRPLLRRVDAHVVHSAFDVEQLSTARGLDPRTVHVIHHGPFDHHGAPAEPTARRDHEPLRVLFFGTIRPYKGLEDLVDAFAALPPQVRSRMHLTIVGETWEGWTAPLLALERHGLGGEVTVVNRYVDDAEVTRHFAAADAVVLPYRRSSASGPLHIAMSQGLPVIVTSVGGLQEAAGAYGGAIFVPPQDVPALSRALIALADVVGRRYADPHSWERTVETYEALFAAIGAGAREAVTA